MVFPYQRIGTCDFLALWRGDLQRAATIRVTSHIISHVIICVTATIAMGVVRNVRVRVHILRVMIRSMCIISRGKMLIVICLCLLSLQLVQGLHVLHVWLIGGQVSVVREITLSFRFKLRDETRAEAGCAVAIKHGVRVEGTCAMKECNRE